MKRLLSLLLAVGLLAPATATAAPVVAGEFPPAGLPSSPNQLTLGPDGNVWVAMESNTRPLVRIRPDGSVTEFAAAAIRSPFGIAIGPDGNLWVTQVDGVARFPTADPSLAQAYEIQALDSPRALTTGPDGNLWTATGRTVLRIPLADPRRPTSFDVDGMTANGIARGGDGNLYVANFGPSLVRVTPAGTVTEIPVTGFLQEVAAGPGTQIGFTQQGASPHYVGFFDNGVLGPPALIPGTDPFGIVFGIDQAYWVANAIVDSLSRVTPTGQISTLGGFTRDSRPQYLANGLNGTLWVALRNSRRIGLVTGLEAPVPPPPPDNPPLVGDRGPPTTTTDPPPTVVPPPLVPGQRPVFTRVSLTRTTTFGRAAQLRLTVADAALVTIRIERKSHGRLARGRCVLRITRANRRGRRCSRYVQRGAIPATVRAGGVVSATFSRRLAVGTYRVSLSASNAAGTATARKPLTVKPRRRAGARPRGRGRPRRR